MTLDIRKVKSENLFRSVSAEVRAVGEDEMEFSFSSELPCERWWGTEILSHAPGAANLERLAGMNLLWNHCPDTVLGKVTQITFKDKRGYCKIRWSKKDSIKGYRQDVEDGIITNASFMYSIDELTASSMDAEDDGDSYLVTKWTIFEISFVSIPADPTVGVGRSFSIKEPKPMTFPESPPQDSPSPQMDERALNILAMGKEHNNYDLAHELIRSGVDELEANKRFRQYLAESKNQRPIGGFAPVSGILNDKEQREFSLLRMCKQLSKETWGRENSLEYEVSQTIARQLGISTNKPIAPIRDLKIDLRQITGRRNASPPLNTQNPDSAGFLINTTLAPTMIEYLVNVTRAFQLGVQRIGNLEGLFKYPRKTGKTSFYYLGEGQGPTSSAIDGDLLETKPHGGGIKTSVTREMLKQSSQDLEQLLRADMMETASLEIDRVIFHGSGINGQPLGLFERTASSNALDNVNVLNTSGNNGGAISFELLIDMVTAVSNANAGYGSRSYVTTPGVTGYLQKLRADGSTGPFLWNGTTADLTRGIPGSVNGYPVAETNQIRSDFAKGNATNLHGIIFGNFAEAFFLEWGTMIFDANTQGAMWDSGGLELKMLMDFDVMVRQAKAFSIIKNIAVPAIT